MSTFKVAESFYSRASNKLEEAREQLTKKYHYPESISASQECIELSLKAIFLYLEEQYPKNHEIADEHYNRLMKKIPKQLEFHNFPRLILISQFWGSFYEIAKYGKEKLGVGPEELFKEIEAKLALEHANSCHSAAYGIRDWTWKQRSERKTI